MMLQNRVDRDDPFHTRGQQESNVLLQVVNIVAMSRDDEEVLVPAEKGFDPTDHQPTVGIADLFADHADGKRPFRAQVAGKEVGPVIQIPSRRKNPVLGALRDRPGHGRVI